MAPMSTDAIIEHCKTLSFKEKLALLGELWNQIEAEESTRPLASEEHDFLEQRLRAVEADPRPSRSWQAVRSDLSTPR